MIDIFSLRHFFNLFSFLPSTIIKEHVSVMVRKHSIIVIFQSILRSCRNTALKLHNVLSRKKLTCSLAALDPALSFQKLILHCITAIYKSLKCLAVITAKNEADNRVDSTAGLCKMYNRGQLRIEQNYMKTKWNCPLH